jgi:predicted Zn finger-like uncharacterized protein
MNEQAKADNRAQCPSCKATVAVDPTRSARRGFMRLKCEACGNRFMLQINRRELKLSDDLETSEELL